MKLPQARPSPKKIETGTETIGFRGLNRMPVLAQGELSAMTNLSSKYAPCLYPRDSRAKTNTLVSGTALSAANQKLCWVDGTDFVYDGIVKGTVITGSKSIIEYFGIILIFPDKKYYNYVTATFGTFTSPDIDYACVYNNRAFGVKGNAFYASKLGDPLTWNYFPVPITNDSCFQTNTGEEGNFTGIISLQNHVMVMKSNYLYELYGNKPANFQLQLIAKSGCIDNKSVVEINGALYFMGEDGFKVYAGSVPKPISLNLNENYISCKAGTDGRKYFASLYNGTSYNLYVYDTLTDMWHREDSLNVGSFARINNTLYALSANGIWQFDSGTEIISWIAETDKFTEMYMGKKVYSKIKIMAEIEAGSSLSMYVSQDEGPYELVDTMSSTGIQLFTRHIMPYRATTFQIKLTGVGKSKVYSMIRELTIGSDVVRNDIIIFNDLELRTFAQLEAFTFEDLNQAEV